MADRQDLRVTTARGESIKLDGAGNASIEFHVQNDSQQPMRIFVHTLPTEIAPASVAGSASTGPTSHPGSAAPPRPAKPGWMKVVGDDKRDLPYPGDVTFTVQLNVPLPKQPGHGTTSPPAPASTQPIADPGEYRFFFRAESVDEPNAHWGRGPDISFTVPMIKKPVCIPCIIIPIAAVLLIGIGLGIYFLMPSSVTVPDLTTSPMQADAAKTLLEKNGLKMGVPTSQPTANSDPGIILWQKISAGTKVKNGTVIDVVEASAEMVPLPDVRTFSEKEAEALLIKFNLVVKYSTVGTGAVGTVMTEDPAPSSDSSKPTMVAAGKPVTLTVKTLLMRPGIQLNRTLQHFNQGRN
jgi:hypothetical protein